MNLDRPLYIVLCHHPKGIFAAERDLPDMNSREKTLQAIFEGQVEDVAAVVEANPVEGTCQDVSEDFARELARMVAGSDEPPRDDLEDFLEAHHA